VDQRITKGKVVNFVEVYIRGVSGDLKPAHWWSIALYLELHGYLTNVVIVGSLWTCNLSSRIEDPVYLAIDALDGRFKAEFFQQRSHGLCHVVAGIIGTM
jgi:hypothetical protein